MGFVTAIILAAGVGARMSSPITKQRMVISGESVLHRTVRAFCECEDINSVVVAVKADETAFAETELKGDFVKLHKIVIGGKTRAESAKIAFEAIPNETDLVAIHDGARCLITPYMISKVVKKAMECRAATAGTLVTDTVKHVDCCGNIDGTLDRDELFFASTPQVFDVELYRRALSKIADINSVTDDNMLLEKIGVQIASVDVGKENIKITTMEDISYAEYLISKRKEYKMRQIRVGHGYDVHKLAENRELILGGVRVPYERGLLGHSDADVLTHAIMDALLGAAALGDIGRHFPDTAEEFRGISSLLLLKRVGELIGKSGYSIVNIDATLILQKPKISAYISNMIKNIADVLSLDSDSINIKATTEEKLGFTGSGDGAAAHAVALIQK